MLKQYIFLYLAFGIDSFATVFGKLASQHETLSLPFIFWYGLDIAVYGVFAILWQQILKKMPLSIAYSNRPIVTILGVIYGVIFFKDRLTVTAVLGIVIIMIGIFLVVYEPKNGGAAMADPLPGGRGAGLAGAGNTNGCAQASADEDALKARVYGSADGEEAHHE